MKTARAAGASGEILVRGDSAYGTSPVVAACLETKVRFSFVLARNTAVAGVSRRSPRGGRGCQMVCGAPRGAVVPSGGERTPRAACRGRSLKLAAA